MSFRVNIYCCGGFYKKVNMSDLFTKSKECVTIHKVPKGTSCTNSPKTKGEWEGLKAMGF